MLNKTRFKYLCGSILIGCSVALATPVYATNDAMLRLIDIMQQKGTLTRAEADALREAAVQDAEQTEGITKEAKKVAEETSRDVIKDIPKIETKGKLKVESADGDFEWQPIGRIMADYSWINSDINHLGSGAEMRRARLGMEGAMWKHWIWKLEFDFAPGEADMKDAWVGYKGDDNWWIKVGQSHIPFGFATMSSSKYMLFTERPFLADGTLQLARHIGVAAFKHAANGRWTLHAGVFAGPQPEDPDGCNITSPTKDECDEQLSIAARGTFLPWMQDANHLINIGGGIWFRDPQDSAVTVEQRPGIFHLLDDKFVSVKFGNSGQGATAGMAADNILAFNAEGLLVYGPFSVGGEYTHWNVNTEPTGGATGSTPDVNFDGYYVEGSYFLTGESMNYKTSKAQYDSIKPNSIVGKGGIGAWQIAARYDVLDLNDSDLPAGVGGEMKGIALGLNWYVNNNMRFMADYYNVLQLDRPGNKFDNDEPSGVTIRGQVKW